MIFPKKILDFLRPLIEELCEGFEVYSRLDSEQEIPDRFVVLSIDEVRDELPGANSGLYRADLTVSAGSRHTGDGCDPSGAARWDVLESIDELLGNWSSRPIDSKTDLAGIKRESIQPDQSNGSHTVAAAKYELFVTQEV